MSIYGIVAEYNPFHNGHLHHIECARSSGADGIVCVLSSSFVQRGELALLSKYTRAAMAASCGVDLVIELPVAYSLGSAERFGRGAISLLDQLGVVDILSFGSECGDADCIRSAAQASLDPRIMPAIQEGTEQGQSWPVARRKAFATLFGEDLAGLLDHPNNVLGIEYCKELIRRSSAIEPHTLLRIGAKHDSDKPSGRYASASALRGMIAAHQCPSPYMPEVAHQMLVRELEAGAICDNTDRIERLILLALRKATPGQLANIVDCTGGLAERIGLAARQARSLKDLYARIKTKRFTLSRVRRAVLCCLLDIDDSYYGEVPYAHILAIGPAGKQLLHDISRRSTLTVSESLYSLMELSGQAGRTAALEVQASEVFSVATRLPQPSAIDRTAKLFVYGRDEL